MSRGAAWIAAALLCAPMAFAQGTSEVTGKVLDAEGKPVVGATITLTNASNAATTFTAKTDKRGGFWIPNILYAQHAPSWVIKVEAQGYTVTKVKVESRLADNTLFDGYEKSIRGTSPPIDFKLKGLGAAKVEFTLGQAEPEPTVASDPLGVAPAIDAKAATPGSPSDPYAEAIAKAGQGDLEGSLGLFKSAIEAAPQDPERHEVYAKVLVRLDRLPEAEKEASAAAQLAPDRAEPKVILADIRATQGDYERAKEHLDAARAINPNDTKILERLAWVAGQAGDTAGAVAANEAIVGINPQNTEAWLALGDLYNRTKEPAKAEAAFRKVVELDPANAYKTFFNIGAIIENRRNLSDADNRKVVEAFRRAIEIKPDYALAHRHLAYALLRTGDIDGARGELQRYLELEPAAKDASVIRETIQSLGPAPAKKKG
jgi:tetratricopeptide (TPR) repeat protein